MSFSAKHSWVGLGFDLRCPLRSESNWSVGDLKFHDFVNQLSHARKGTVSKILSADVNLSPRPWERDRLLTGAKAFEVPRLRTWASVEAVIEQANAAESSIKDAQIIFWEIDSVGLKNGQNSGSLRHLMGAAERPLGWSLIGHDVINDGQNSELWDPFENTFWKLDPALERSVNGFGLLEDTDAICKVIDHLPAQPNDFHYVSLWRAWIPTVC